jgi:uncharacterized small protein (DUF1192 family)
MAMAVISCMASPAENSGFGTVWVELLVPAMTKWHKCITEENGPMSFEDLPKEPARIVIGENLDLLSVSELEQRIQSLESEIERIREAIDAKKASKHAADAFFRS